MNPGDILTFQPSQPDIVFLRRGDSDIRDEVAMRAMQSLVIRDGHFHPSDREKVEAASVAFDYADAFMVERAKRLAAK